MNREVILKISLENPTHGVDYGLQEGKGADFKTIQTKEGLVRTWNLNVV